MQFFVPLVLSAGLLWRLLWLPSVLAAAICAYLFMNNVDVARDAVQSQFATVKRPTPG
jgi:NNP family nitrate/nitrite transporter-like MFS transporter